ncbi:MAG: P27 family phage terminase small subunit [Armatimonadota bacterium]|jgi:P27 family predicted phage terminase small subunit
MPTKKPPTPPAHLSRESKARWVQIVTEWQLQAEDADAVLLLEQALTALDRAAQARAVIEDLGVVIRPENGGMVRANPAAKIEADAMRAARLALKQLNLDPTIADR